MWGKILSLDLPSGQSVVKKQNHQESRPWGRVLAVVMMVREWKWQNHSSTLYSFPCHLVLPNQNQQETEAMEKACKIEITISYNLIMKLTLITCVVFCQLEASYRVPGKPTFQRRGPHKGMNTSSLRWFECSCPFQNSHWNLIPNASVLRGGGTFRWWWSYGGFILMDGISVIQKGLKAFHFSSHRKMLEKTLSWKQRGNLHQTMNLLGLQYCGE